VGMPVLDHLIITEKGYFSFTDTGLLEQIMAESHYDLTFSQIDRLKEQMRANERKAERRMKEKDERIVKALRKEKISVEKIAAITGLSVAEVKKI
jgi:hypothetical protein